LATTLDGPSSPRPPTYTDSENSEYWISMLLRNSTDHFLHRLWRNKALDSWRSIFENRS
jgi:hypothetical protein